MAAPICAFCHTNKYMGIMHISNGFTPTDIRVGNNRLHQVDFFCCGKCGTLRVDNTTATLIKDSIDKKDMKGN